MKNKWEIIILPDVEKKIKRIQPREQTRVKKKVLALEDGIGNADFKKLGGHPEWSLQVGKWRVLFLVDLKSRIMTATGFGSRGDVYKK